MINGKYLDITLTRRKALQYIGVGAFTGLAQLLVPSFGNAEHTPETQDPIKYHKFVFDDIEKEREQPVNETLKGSPFHHVNYNSSTKQTNLDTIIEDLYIKNPEKPIFVMLYVDERIDFLPYHIHHATSSRGLASVYKRFAELYHNKVSFVAYDLGPELKAAGKKTLLLDAYLRTVDQKFRVPSVPATLIYRKGEKTDVVEHGYVKGEQAFNEIFGRFVDWIEFNLIKPTEGRVWRFDMSKKPRQKNK